MVAVRSLIPLSVPIWCIGNLRGINLTITVESLVSTPSIGVLPDIDDQGGVGSASGQVYHSNFLWRRLYTSLGYKSEERLSTIIDFRCVRKVLDRHGPVGWALIGARCGQSYNPNNQSDGRQDCLEFHDDESKKIMGGRQYEFERLCGS